MKGMNQRWGALIKLSQRRSKWKTFLLPQTPLVVTGLVDNDDNDVDDIDDDEKYTQLL